MMKRQALCVHAHFYQPPREDPFTGEIPLEPGAMPYSNWNERIYHQCYKPNAELGNFEYMSFNIGPTLVSWLARRHPETLKMIVEQEQKNFTTYKVGNALAQAYHHIILPLAKYHDKVTQIRWGIADFEFHFGHKPAGMWLPETAVDHETLEVLSENGIEFTLLAPWQAEEDDLDVTQPYKVALKNGAKHINIFFYDDLSGHVSFNAEMTINADLFVQKYLLPAYLAKPGNGGRSQIVIIASDGELYGHHQPHREKFLQYLLNGALDGTTLQPSYLGLWLKMHPPRNSAIIKDNTSWSCHHGILRWKGVCACTPHGAWKAPLREALDDLAEAIDNEFLKVVQKYLGDPWELRHQYIQVVNKRMTLPALLESLVGHRLEADEVTKIDLLLRAQYERQRMFTSCGWFFDDFDRIEPRNNIAYAAKAVCLTEAATGKNLAPMTLESLRRVESWRSGIWGSTVFTHQLKCAHFDRQKTKP